MNLAEIRKKAGGEKKSARVVTEPQPPEVENLSEIPEEFEPFVDETLMPDDSVDTEEFDYLPDFSPELPVNALVPNEPEQTVTLDVCQDVVEETEEPPIDVAEPVKTTKPENPDILQEKNAVRSGFNPLATILSGRMDAEDSEEDSAFQQYSLSAGDIEEYLCFRVADEEYAMNIMSIKEIIKPREITEVPRMPNFISGVISLRGVIIPVMDMRLRLSLPFREKTGRERIIVLRSDAGFCGVLVDEVVQVARILKSNIEEPPAVLEEIDRDFVKGLGHFDNRMLILLNIEAITDIELR